jgi:putative ABC transport system permease protein
MVIGRQIGGRPETVAAPLVVIGEVAATLQPRPALYVALADLLAVEVYRDRAEVTLETWREQPPPEHYASFRLYARDLVDLAPLAAALETGGARVRPRAPNAPLLIEFRDRLDRLFLVIASLAYAGFWAAMAANLRAGVERQRIAFSLFGLLGLSGGEARAIPLIQGVVLILAGIALSLGLVVPFLGLANDVFTAGAGGMVARLDSGTILATVGLGLLTALTAGVWAAAAAGRIGSDEVLRHA